MTTRIYIVEEKNAKDRLVEGSTAMQVLRHCATPNFSIRVANTREVAQRMAAGTTVEQAKANEAAA